MTSAVTVVDPLGKIIYLLPHLILKLNSAKDIIDEISTVITKPAILVEVKENKETELYYFRSVGSNKTFLIIIRLINKRWEAYQCIKNPAGVMLSTVLKKGKQIF